MNTKTDAFAFTRMAGWAAATVMQQISFVKLALAIAACLMISTAASAQLTIDDFSSGAYSKTLKEGHDFNTQTGSMAGGSRYTSYVSCPDVNCAGGGKGDNPFDQPNSFQIKPGTKTSALLYNSGYKTTPTLLIQYGTGSPMTLDMSSDDAIRLNFDGTNQNINMNVALYGGGESSALGCNIIAPEFMKAFDVDFPFANFDGTADLSAVNLILVEIGVAEGAFAELDFGLTSIQAVPSTEPPANVICGSSSDQGASHGSLLHKVPSAVAK